MSGTPEIIVSMPGGRRIDAAAGKHVIHTDQPRDNGGEDSAPSPFDLFLASLGACAGIFVQGFCQKRGIPSNDVRIIQRNRFDDSGDLEQVDLQVVLPPGFPERYRDALVRSIEQCSVKRSIQAEPTFRVHTVKVDRTDALQDDPQLGVYIPVS